uniref:Integrase catalytic domain-containing protein n=1 Tax=Heterorhabditis bacteriophora TaxID=37862 RepID=A0A1I7WS67_HETBA
MAKPYALREMPPLTAIRVNPAIPFDKTGADYCGPFTVTREGEERCYKIWIALFTCLVTRAIHLEIVMELSSETFINVFRRFIARRGCPSLLLTDNGTNFRGAAELITSLWTEQQDNSLYRFCKSKQIEWKFIPSLEPWFGRAYERMIGILKESLRRARQKHPPEKGNLRRIPVSGEVIIGDKLQPIRKWKLGRIKQIHSSEDGIVWSVEVLNSNGRIIKRSIRHVLPLEIQSTQELQIGSESKNKEQSAEPACYNLRPTTDKKRSFFILSLLAIALITTTIAENCKKKNPVFIDSCSKSGVIIYKNNKDSYCWSYESCEICRARCRCPSWANGCSYGHREQRTNSTIERLFHQMKPDVCSFKRTVEYQNPVRRKIHKVRLVDGKDYFVKSLGRNEYCARYPCVSSGTQICTFSKTEATYIQSGEVLLPIIAWATTELEVFNH